MSIRLSLASFVLLLAGSFMLAKPSFAQQAQVETQRKVINRVVPVYPDLARTMNVRGTVRLEAVVAPNGTLKEINVKGGHPVLVQAAQNALHKWKWEPAKEKTRQLIELRFNPD